MPAPFAEEIKADMERRLADWCDECLGSGVECSIDLFNVNGERHKGRQYRPCSKCGIVDA